ncbi:MAG TPA: hypothetical protein VFV38_17800 [Ktedonobacteraceae bacterium]|nr:hypothetical protein [Ktedonobacteraceae bacterium]
MNIVELFDLLVNSSGALWMEISEELLEAGYTWELVCSASGNEIYWLKDLSAYFV